MIASRSMVPTGPPAGPHTGPSTHPLAGPSTGPAGRSSTGTGVHARSDDAWEPSDAELLETWRDIRRAVTAVDGRLTGTPVGVSAPGVFLHDALAALAAAPERMAPMAGLAELLGLGPTACSALVDRMVAAGWAQRRHAGADRTLVYVALTESGAAHERVSTAHHAQQLRVELSVVGPERLTHLREACRLLRAWDPDQAHADVETLVSPRGPRRADLMGLPRAPAPSRARHFAPRRDHA